MQSLIRKNAKGLAIVLSAVMTISMAGTSTSEAKGKKPKLSTTKVNIQVGKTKKIKVKNA